jgi:protein-tyrosine phosphatase
VSKPEPAPLRILLVCTANICRSPMAAALLQVACATRDLPVVVSSAGFLFDGHPASDTTIKVMRERGIDLRDHRSRVVDESIIGAADLVLTMERRHARDLVLQFDRAEMVHTLKGFLSVVTLLLASDDLDPSEVIDLPGLVRAANIARSPVGLLGDDRPDEIADPHGRSVRVHRKTADDLTAVVDAMAVAFDTVGSRTVR